VVAIEAESFAPDFLAGAGVETPYHAIIRGKVAAAVHELGRKADGAADRHTPLESPRRGVESAERVVARRAEHHETARDHGLGGVVEI
jgi:hypothetical protein